MIEERKDVVWFELLYMVNNLWQIKTHYWKIRKLFICDTWYYVVSITDKNKVVHTKKVHRLVAMAFIPNLYNKPQINHKDWNKLNNNIDNLEWVTQSENVKHSYDKLNHKKHLKWKLWKLNNNSKKIWQFYNDICIAEYYWCWEAQRNTWIAWPNINKCCKWHLYHAWWYIWKYI